MLQSVYGLSDWMRLDINCWVSDEHTFNFHFKLKKKNHLISLFIKEKQPKNSQEVYFHWAHYGNKQYPKYITHTKKITFRNQIKNTQINK